MSGYRAKRNGSVEFDGSKVKLAPDNEQAKGSGEQQPFEMIEDLVDDDGLERRPSPIRAGGFESVRFRYPDLDE